MNTRLSLSLVLLLFVAGCTTLWTTTVTLTATVDSASKEYAHLFNSGAINANVDAKVTEAHAAYQKSAATAAAALRAYKLSGDLAQYNAAFTEALNAARQFINLVVPFFTNAKAAEINTQLAKANRL